MARVPATVRQRFGDDGIGMSAIGPVVFKAVQYRILPWPVTENRAPIRTKY
jgi:hypothetical protein